MSSATYTGPIQVDGILENSRDERITGFRGWKETE